MERCALYWSVCGITTDMGSLHVVLCFITANRDAKLIIFVFLYLDIAKFFQIKETPTMA